MTQRRRIPEKVRVAVLVDNLHTCCICRVAHLHVQLHHIDGNPGNNDPNNIAVLCPICHSKVTGDEGLGQRYSASEVSEFKRRWEELCKAASAAAAERRLIESSMELRTSLEFTGQELLRPIYTNPELARREGAKVKCKIGEHFGFGEYEKLTEALKLAGKLSMDRPNVFKEFVPGNAILETVKATKIVFPHPVLSANMPQISELAVWVADPDNRVIEARDDSLWTFNGTFLYLVTPLYNHSVHETFLSGCSALQVIANVVTGQPFFKTHSVEPFGRDSFLHPTDKLRSLGGVVVDRRQLEVLYSPRYMTDEQCFTTPSGAYRVHDLLAYPLFIHNEEQWSMNLLTARLDKLEAERKREREHHPSVESTDRTKSRRR